MTVVSNEELDILYDVEHLLHKKLEETNSNNEEWETWTKYWNMVERLIVNKKERNKKQGVWNKNNKDYHRITNNISNNRVRGNKEREEYWKGKLKELRENDSKQAYRNENIR